MPPADTGTVSRPDPDGRVDLRPCRSTPTAGPSYLREHEVRIGIARSEPGWRARRRRQTAGGWRCVVTDDDGVVSFCDVAPASGPPPDPPLARLGPALSGALSGFSSKMPADSRCGSRMLVPPDDPEQTWLAPLAVRRGFRFEPARAATMRANELADTVLGAFRRSVEALHRP